MKEPRDGDGDGFVNDGKPDMHPVTLDLPDEEDEADWEDPYIGHFAQASSDETHVMSDRDMKNVSLYFGGGFEMVNGLLRGNVDRKEIEAVWDEDFLGTIEDNHASQVKSLDRMFSDPRAEVDFPFVVHRGGPDLDLGVGDIFQDKGYVSTTRDAEIAANYNAQSTKWYKIKVLEGVRAIYAPNMAGIDNPFVDKEQEWLLDRDLNFLVTAVDGDDITLEVWK